METAKFYIQGTITGNVRVYVTKNISDFLRQYLIVRSIWGGGHDKEGKEYLSYEINQSYLMDLLHVFSCNGEQIMELNIDFVLKE